MGVFFVVVIVVVIIIYWSNTSTKSKTTVADVEFEDTWEDVKSCINDYLLLKGKTGFEFYSLICVPVEKTTEFSVNSNRLKALMLSINDMSQVSEWIETLSKTTDFQESEVAKMASKYDFLPFVSRTMGWGLYTRCWKTDVGFQSVMKSIERKIKEEYPEIRCEITNQKYISVF